MMVTCFPEIFFSFRFWNIKRNFLDLYQSSNDYHYDRNEIQSGIITLPLLTWNDLAIDSGHDCLRERLCNRPNTFIPAETLQNVSIESMTSW